MYLLGIICILFVIYEGIKTALTPEIPAENWANKDQMHKDRMAGMSEKEILKNVERGRYYSDKKYPGCNRDPEDGKRLIQNCKLHRLDVSVYGAVQAYKWLDQGKYNLTRSELKKEEDKLFTGEELYVPQWVMEMYYNKTSSQREYEESLKSALVSMGARVTYLNYIENTMNLSVALNGEQYDMCCSISDEQYKKIDFTRDSNLSNNVTTCFKMLELLTEIDSLESIKRYFYKDGFEDVIIKWKCDEGYKQYYMKGDHSRVIMNKGGLRYSVTIYSQNGFEEI